MVAHGFTSQSEIERNPDLASSNDLRALVTTFSIIAAFAMLVVGSVGLVVGAAKIDWLRALVPDHSVAAAAAFAASGAALLLSRRGTHRVSRLSALVGAYRFDLSSLA